MTGNNAIQATVPTVSIGGVDLPAPWYDALLEVHVDLEFRVPGRAVLRFLDEGYALVSGSKVKLGAPVTIGARRPGQVSDDVLLKGLVTGIAVEQSATRQPELVVTVHDKAHLLTRGTTVQTWAKAKYSDVVSQIASTHGLRAEADSTAVTFDYVMQADSALGLLNAMADRIGFDWWVDGDVLHFHEPMTGARSRQQIALVLGTNLIEFDVRASGLHADAVKVQGWDRQKKAAIAASAQASGASTKPDSEMFQPFVSPHAKLGGTAQTTLSAAIPVQSVAEAQQLANALRDSAVASAVTASGTVVHGSQLLPGVKVQISDAGPTSGSYHVSRVQHIFRTSFETRFVAGERRPTSLVDTLGGVGPRGDGMRHVGMVVGQVTNINDEAKSGRVKVQYPGIDSEHESAWARVTTVGGGSSRGLVVLPEVGDEVLVGFENGDLRQPVVIGGLFGDQNKIPLWDVENGKVNGRRLTSRLGHVVELKDGTAPADQYVLLQLAGEKHLVKLAKDRLDITVPAGVPVSLKAGDNASLVFDAAGSLQIKAVNITMEATGQLTLSSKGPAKLEATAPLTVQSQAVTAVKGALLQLEASGPTVIKGATVAIN